MSCIQGAENKMRSPPVGFMCVFLSLCLLINLAAQDETEGSFTQCLKELSLLLGIQKASFGHYIVFSPDCKGLFRGAAFRW